MSYAIEWQVAKENEHSVGLHGDDVHVYEIAGNDWIKTTKEGFWAIVSCCSILATAAALDEGPDNLSFAQTMGLLFKHLNF